MFQNTRNPGLAWVLSLLSVGAWPGCRDFSLGRVDARAATRLDDAMDAGVFREGQDASRAGLRLINEPCDSDEECRAATCVDNRCTPARFEQLQKVKHPDPGTGLLGWSLAADNGEVLVGLYSESHLQYPADPIILNEQSDGWGVGHRLTEREEPTPDLMQPRVSISGSRIVVGNYGQAHGKMTDAGRVHHYERGADGWTYQGFLESPTPSQGGAFGWPVLLLDEYMLVGEAFFMAEPMASGLVHLYALRAGKWKLLETFAAPEPAAGDSFGWAFAAEATTAVIGAYDETAERPGSVYLFDLKSTEAPPQQLDSALALPGDNYGFDVAIDGQTIGVGAPQHDEGGSAVGAVFIWEIRNGDWTEVQKLTASTPEIGMTFGNELLLLDDTLFVAAPTTSEVYVFRRNPDEWVETQILSAESSNGLGSFMAWTKETLFVAAPLDDAFSETPGAVYIYSR